MRRRAAFALFLFALLPAPRLPAEATRHHEEVGRVTEVAPDPKNAKLTAITLSSHGHDFATIKADATTKVTKGGDAAALQDVAVGDNVKATVDDDENATSIEIRIPKKK